MVANFNEGLQKRHFSWTALKKITFNALPNLAHFCPEDGVSRFLLKVDNHL
jgi:hypothetical protein